MARGNFRKGAEHGGYRHGMHSTPTYKSWQAMKQRCSNPNAPDFVRYGARGISYDPAWEDFENFYRDMGDRPEGCSLERKDNDGNYDRVNCKWETPHKQTRNRRDTRLLSFRGKTQCLLDWAADLGIPRSTLNNRIHRGWPVERALSGPRRRSV